MQSLKTLAMMLAVTATTVQAGDTPKAGPPPPAPIPADMVPDPNWRPKPGDRATVVLDDAPTLPDAFTYNDFMKFAAAKDEAGLGEFEKGKVVAKVRRGTGVLILTRFRPEEVRASRTYHSGADFSRAIQEAALTPARPETDYPFEVRILDGPLKDHVRYIPDRFVARLIPAAQAAPVPLSARLAPGPRPKPKTKPTPGKVDPAARAAGLLKIAQNLEKAGKTGGALDSFRRIARDFPGTPQAKAAAGRIEALGAE